LGGIFAENKGPVLFAMVTWVVWNRQNNLRLGKIDCQLDQLLKQARERLLEFSLHNTSTIAPVGRPTRWQPPRQSWFKINFDGALFHSENSASIGVMI